MANFLASIWCLIGIIVGLMVLFLMIVGVVAVIEEAVKKDGGE